jgi:hypothetical protein
MKSKLIFLPRMEDKLEAVCKFDLQVEWVTQL